LHPNNGPPNKRLKWDADSPQTMRNPIRTTAPSRPHMQGINPVLNRNGDIDNIGKYLREKDRANTSLLGDHNQTGRNPVTIRNPNNFIRPHPRGGYYNPRASNFEKASYGDKGPPQVTQMFPKNVNGRPQHT
jgi:hypothetical protein